jgi:hypothetical protein
VFQPDPAVQFVSATREQVVAVVESINQPQVSVPGRPAQTCTGNLCGIRNANGTLSIFVGLHFPATGENVVYASDRRQLATVDEYREVEVEALGFLESMGFMLDNLNFRNLPADVQEKTLKRVPIFSPPRPPAPAPTPAAPLGAAPPAPGAGAGLAGVATALAGTAPLGAALPPGAAAPHPAGEDAARLARLLASF